MNIIPRGENPRTIRCDPVYTYFKPRGVPLSKIVGEVAITFQELEALRLTDLNGLSQQEAGEEMKISQSSISRHLEKAHRKIAKALVEGFAIRIGNPTDFFHCAHCGYTWLFPEDLTTVEQCESCGSTDYHPHIRFNNENQIKQKHKEVKK